MTLFIDDHQQQLIIYHSNSLVLHSLFINHSNLLPLILTVLQISFINPIHSSVLITQIHLLLSIPFLHIPHQLCLHSLTSKAFIKCHNSKHQHFARNERRMRRGTTTLQKIQTLHRQRKTTINFKVLIQLQSNVQINFFTHSIYSNPKHVVQLGATVVFQSIINRTGVVLPFNTKVSAILHSFPKRNIPNRLECSLNVSIKAPSQVRFFTLLHYFVYYN